MRLLSTRYFTTHCHPFNQGTAIDRQGAPLLTPRACRDEIFNVVRQHGGIDFNLQNVNFLFPSTNSLRDCEAALGAALPWVRWVFAPPPATRY